ncbi:MAG: pentapeptide repeat-containing protein [Xenococcaceae cyanobacterium MO_188.B29]|nr:pentapeptide repeat-containing protein [Xenococcaceae cyanobacterium MO_188.B29]
MKENSLTIYQEYGEKIEPLDEQRATQEIQIALENIFVSNYRIYGSFHRWELGFFADSNSEADNRTNFLVLIAGANLGDYLDNNPSLSTNFSDRATLSSLEEEAILVSNSTINQDVNQQVQKLLTTKECIRCNLQGADLSGADLQEANLEGANLEGANLQQAQLKQAYLVGANLSQANLEEVDLNSANLTLAKLPNSVLKNADLKGANLQAADLQQADLQAANLRAPALLQSANLTQANLSNTNLKGTNFDRANLTEANLTQADLRDANVSLKGIPGNYTIGERVLDSLIRVPIFRITNSGVDFKTSLQEANLEGANLQNALLEEVSLIDANLNKVNLNGAKLEDTDLEVANVCATTMPDGTISDRDC